MKNLKWLGQDGQLLTAGNSGKTPPGQLKKIKGGDGSGDGKGKNKGEGSEKFQYFYHPDHLGSTSYITDASGEVYQHLEYFAFGETFVEEHNNRKHTPYKFNGKELDEETGLYYYGARYYDAKTSVWLAVDPHADRYPYLSPYTYVNNNPIKMGDPDGRDGRARYARGQETKKSPHVVTITANYYYNSNNLTADEVRGLKATVANYNRTEGKVGKSREGTYTVVRFEMNAVPLQSDESVKNSALADTFIDSDGDTQGYGNIVVGRNAEGDEYGDADGATIRINRTNVDNTVSEGFSIETLLERVFNHEVGHNLGGEHGDGAPMEASLTSVTKTNQITSGSQNKVTKTFSGGILNKKFFRTLFPRIGRNNGGGQIKYEQGYTPSEQ